MGRGLSPGPLGRRPPVSAMLDHMSLLPQSSVDKRLLKAAREYKSPNEMSEAVLRQLTPAQCATRVQEILDSKTMLDEVQERRLLVISMAEHLEWLRGQRDNPQSWNAIARSYKLLSDQIERTNVNVNDVSTKLAEAHAQVFVSGLSIGFEALLRAISEKTGNEDLIEGEVMPELLAVAASASQDYIGRMTQKSID